MEIIMFTVQVYSVKNRKPSLFTSFVCVEDTWGHAALLKSINSCNCLHPVSVFMNIVLWLKSWHLAEKPDFPHKHCRGGICTSYPKKLKQHSLMFFKAALEF